MEAIRASRDPPPAARGSSRHLRSGWRPHAGVRKLCMGERPLGAAAIGAGVAPALPGGNGSQWAHPLGDHLRSAAEAAALVWRTGSDGRPQRPVGAFARGAAGVDEADALRSGARPSRGPDSGLRRASGPHAGLRWSARPFVPGAKRCVGAVPVGSALLARAGRRGNASSGAHRWHTRPRSDPRPADSLWRR